MAAPQRLWALIALGNHIFKVKVHNYSNITESNQISITTEDGTNYITDISNVIISNKEPIIKERRAN